MSLIGFMYASKTNSEHSQIKQDLIDILTEAVNSIHIMILQECFTMVMDTSCSIWKVRKNRSESLFYKLIFEEIRDIRTVKSSFSEPSEQRLFKH